MFTCRYCFSIEANEGGECESSPIKLHAPKSYHLPGQHDQQRHAGDGGGAVDMVIEKHGLTTLYQRVGAGAIPIKAITPAEVKKIIARDPANANELGVGGFYDYQTRSIALKADAAGHVVAHELGHALDNKLGGGGDSWYSSTSDFSAPYRADTKALDAWGRRESAYRRSRKEVFADAVAYATTGESSANASTVNFKLRYSRTIEHVRQLLLRGDKKFAHASSAQLDGYRLALMGFDFEPGELPVMRQRFKAYLGQQDVATNGDVDALNHSWEFAAYHLPGGHDQQSHGGDDGGGDNQGGAAGAPSGVSMKERITGQKARSKELTKGIKAEGRDRGWRMIGGFNATIALGAIGLVSVKPSADGKSFDMSYFKGRDANPSSNSNHKTAVDALSAAEKLMFKR